MKAVISTLGVTVYHLLPLTTRTSDSTEGPTLDDPSCPASSRGISIDVRQLFYGGVSGERDDICSIWE